MATTALDFENTLTVRGVPLLSNTAGMTVVVHGGTAGTARPSGATAVQWNGTVTPTNMTTADVYYNTSTGLMYNSAGTSVGGASGGAVATDVLWDAKGDLAVGTGANTAAKLTVGTDGQVPVADASQSTGLIYRGATIVVNHGAAAGTARPAGAAQVMWVGSVTPTNGVNPDLYFDTGFGVLRSVIGDLYLASNSGLANFRTVGGFYGLQQDAFGNQVTSRYVRANGTVASPTALAANDIIAQLQFLGATGTPAYQTAARIDVRANEAFGATAAGADLLVYVTPNGSITPAERFRISGGGTTTVTGTLTTTDTVTLPAGTTTLDPLAFTAGTNLTTPVTGASEFDGKSFYTTPASGRGVAPSMQFAAVQADFTLANATGLQNAFPTVSDVLTVAGSTTYFFDGQFITTQSGASTRTTNLAFTLGGGASTTAINYTVIAFAATGPTATLNAAAISTAASSQINLTTTSALHCTFRGVMRINAGGTITPQIAFSAAPGGTSIMKVGSYIRLYPVGTNTVASVGPWA